MRLQSFKIDAKIINNENFNLGLFYFKYLPFLKEELSRHGFNQNDQHIKWKEQKDRLLKDVIKISQNLNLSLIKKRINEVKKLGDVKEVELQTQSRFLCGVGYQNRIEWGFSFDWTTGVPYLPGSSFKGALLSYLEFLNDSNPVQDWQKESVSLLNDSEIQFNKDEIFEIFGPQGKNISRAAQGKVIFFDVYPFDFKGLEIDVITPHYQKYYSDKGQTPPADIYNPIPQYFLTVPKDTTFQFIFRLLPGADARWESKLKKLIQEAGENYGFGAKTATGYGYFR